MLLLLLLCMASVSLSVWWCLCLCMDMYPANVSPTQILPKLPGSVHWSVRPARPWGEEEEVLLTLLL